jgi:hypothetical protein
MPTSGGAQGTNGPLQVWFELSFPPMGILALGIEHALDVTVLRLHDPNPRYRLVKLAAPA